MEQRGKVRKVRAILELDIVETYLFTVDILVKTIQQCMMDVSIEHTISEFR